MINGPELMDAKVDCYFFLYFYISYSMKLSVLRLHSVNDRVINEYGTVDQIPY
jgi:hypothetical protein